MDSDRLGDNEAMRPDGARKLSDMVFIRHYVWGETGNCVARYDDLVYDGTWAV